MNGKPSPENPGANELDEELDAELAALLAMCEEEAKPPIEKRESSPEVKDFERMVALFDESYSVEKLQAITLLTINEVTPSHILRNEAKFVVSLISHKLTILRNETNIDPETYGKLEQEYLRLTSAVGFLRASDQEGIEIVDHDRTIRKE